MKTKESSLKAITDQGLLPLFFYEDAEVSLEIIRTLYQSGIRVLEYTNRGAAALANFRFLINAVEIEMKDLHLGIGTIKNTAEAHDFIKAGAHFLVCPVVDPEVGKIAHDAGLLWIPGCFTPTEINIAHQLKAGIIKLFPANVLGPVYLSSVKEVFPGQLFIPTGGVEIEEENMTKWFKSGVCAVGMGSKLISKEILETRDYQELAIRTQKTIEMVKATR
ncbi:2-dehydro-3-deoxyphosphogluconate aldolase/(4S)-4-hydroxy-2-oxoglutarate aldolase [Pedobacter cryoconitis]|uniref:2-dehydro-3-deoxyphosphogluconate aldolase/(4S)-4-hydroxy-2-oxoglutarate aldolase n=1 Tax=Pedobacter cryoconitis TaxID=188932 RepID=A0A7W9DX30_9SPHI|nr:bifunctional 4-hydroxy-2-oxoglutarate aldolase/2-dehydro-3-deoxy-phosphogluconate aldolase [Pedobacter cryoconitis]MBB5634491.1 2-dehydro-3-deoxyphosphogluconate aldolase/(4S)-4-hydroxy-2-oxoglutarate aldolase [Pedobacter cryoconitis]MBB6272383.1 2-dehydro-3-deoxyphosphogluconate aldolase/(4S)-4-hydroxy-2-oxoglutarate aldolase [Pedobacter cryoconitis]